MLFFCGILIKFHIYFLGTLLVKLERLQLHGQSRKEDGSCAHVLTQGWGGFGALKQLLVMLNYLGPLMNVLIKSVNR